MAPRPDAEPVMTDPRDVGIDPAGLERAVDLATAHGAAYQLCVRRDGRLVLDRSSGCSPTDLFWIFSAGKPYTSVLVLALAEHGAVSLDDPVARWWPEFARHGKGDITIRHVLQHRSGLPTAGSLLGDALVISDWDRSVHRIAHARPRWPAGAVPAYQILTFGFILGEVVRRATGVPVQDLLRTEILDPLGAADTYLGLPADQWSRHVPLRIRGPLGLPVQHVLNRRSTREAVIPSAGVSTTARDLATFYDMLLHDGRANGRAILRPETVQLLRTPSSDGEVDRYAGFEMRWAHGIQLGGGGTAADPRGSLGRLANPRAFGQNGSGCCLGWADPDLRLVVTYLTNRFDGRRSGADHQVAVGRAVIDACGPLAVAPGPA